MRRQLAAFVVIALASAPRAAAAHPAAAYPAAALAEALHPLHTTVAELRLAPDGVLSVSLRTFSDDFSAAVARATHSAVLPNHTVSAEAASRYVREALELHVAGVPVSFRLVSQRRDGDVTLIELRAERPCRSLSGARFLNRMLMEFHGDQVNLLKASYGGRTYTTLFSQGATAKALP